MTSFTIQAELDETLTADNSVALVTPVETRNGAVGRSALGRAELFFCVEADDIRDAIETAQQIVGDYYEAALVALRAVSSEDFEREADTAPLPALSSVSEAAEALDVSRQRVLQLVTEGKLPATKIGTTWAIRTASLH